MAKQIFKDIFIKFLYGAFGFQRFDHCNVDF